MYILGLNAGPDLVYEETSDSGLAYSHDSAAVLLRDGKVVAGIEEERLNRMKHSSKAPVQAIRYCLEQGGIGIEEIDYIAFYLSFERARSELNETRQGILRYILIAFGYEFPSERILFINHQLAHAMSTYAMSGFEQALVFSVDGSGDGISGMILSAENKQMKTLYELPRAHSLGDFYERIIQFLGYKRFDEYKVMGLAPYGDPSVYRTFFKKFYSLLPGGDYRIHVHLPLLFDLVPPRKKSEPFNQQHKDIAAALQESLEEIVTHIVTHYQKVTGHKQLCLAGGVAHNCTMNGKLLYSGLFKNIFVQPAAHDAGAALGAALCVHYKQRPQDPFYPLEHLYWGPHIGNDAEILETLSPWESWLEWEYVGDELIERTAELLADGSVIGWVQGRSEFGPRALGNRSIIADPRPAENKEIINAMVKMREGYRPFAPSVLEEKAADYFEVPGGMEKSPYMIFVLNVKEDKRKLLGAITHVDGTARIQTVSSQTNPRYWSLIRAFEALTGIPIILNTSFNNNVEPIVDSATDAIVSYLTTKLNYLVIGNYLIRKKAVSDEAILHLYPKLPCYAVLYKKRGRGGEGQLETKAQVCRNDSESSNMPISVELFELLAQANGKRTFQNIIVAVHGQDELLCRSLAAEMHKLWSHRLVELSPAVHEDILGIKANEKERIVL
ncbi:hypothetical protein BS614_20710 [Paenibacillus xylanexedens]|uniref:carbamoyltransferase family protein n=1 Tax=Paenibacillus xylanexedens TaxID=528191 RepID=UPI00093821DC|nr:carbamoyltransferase C-terminal domain-containing protein [Paenibacillus xylanexedens]APO46205.1 hypothetical protein BS614_20710 [Paenibacillus xylanexedens]